MASLVVRLENLEQQCASLARQNRWLKLGGAFLLLLTGLALASSFDLPRWKGAWGGGPVAATEFVLQDESGKRRAAWRMTAGEPVLEFLGPYGTPRIVLAARKDQSQLVLYEENGHTRVALTTGKEQPSILLGDVPATLGDTQMAALQVGEQGPKLFFADVHPVRDRYVTVERASLTVAEDGPHLRLFDTQGKPTFSAGAAAARELGRQHPEKP
jgi:hypothetical protein